MKYCKSCILPDTRPGLQIDLDGVCNACKGHRLKDYSLAWDKRKKDFEMIVSMAKKRKSGYDCIIPVSGGKDSTWQTVKCIEYGLKILAVTWRTPARTAIGQQNLYNLIRLGVDHIDYSINPETERRFMYKTLLKTGSTAVPMHMALCSIPLKIAVAFNIPLVIWGENPLTEYGAAEEDRNYNRLDRTWLSKHGILQGTVAEDWIDNDLTGKDLAAYLLPGEQEFMEKEILSIFLGYYFRWDPEESLNVARAHGFRVREEGPKVGFYNYADIDCDFISVHHHFKWLKFGFTRLFDNLSIEIRNGRMTRDEAIKIIIKKGDQTPYDDIGKLCKFLRITLEQYHDIEEKFRNRDIWKKDGKGEWYIPGFIGGRQNEADAE